MPSIQIGTEFAGPEQEKFKITAFIGRGSFGEVYAAMGDSSAKVVAAKFLPEGTQFLESSKRALSNEARAALRGLSHPNVVRVLFFHLDHESELGSYIVMEYISGGTLAAVLRSNVKTKTQIPLERSLEMMIDVAQGAKAINEYVIHRDIKPDNILIEGKVLKIGDFGISKFVTEQTRLHTFKGGQHCFYMAPEGWENTSNTIKLDVYAVGLVFYEILTLKHPLLEKVANPDSHSDWQLAHLFAACQDVRSSRPEVPAAIAQLLRRMVEKSPDRRPEWDEVLTVLSQPTRASSITRPAVTAIVEATLSRQEAEQQIHLDAQAKQFERERSLAFYRVSCEQLLHDFEAIVDEFNREHQDSQIRIRLDGPITVYDPPVGRSLSVVFFPPMRPGVKIQRGEVIGGAWIGMSNGRSANLVLLKLNADDIYGHWLACEVGLMALANPARLMGKFGLTGETVMPFGFRQTYFYDQIQYATGIMHAFTYSFSDPVEFYLQLLLDATKS